MREKTVTESDVGAIEIGPRFALIVQPSLMRTIHDYAVIASASMATVELPYYVRDLCAFP